MEVINANYDGKNVVVEGEGETIDFYYYESSGCLNYIPLLGLLWRLIAEAIFTKKKFLQKIHYSEITEITYDATTLTFRFTDGVGDKHTLRFNEDNRYIKRLQAVKPKAWYER